MPFVNFWKIFCLFCFNFCQNFDVWTFSQWLSIRGTKFILRDIQKFFFKIFTLVLLDRFLDGFSKFWFLIGEICILIRDFWVIFENYSMHMLSIGGNDFIACWAYAEPISSHAEHTRTQMRSSLVVRASDCQCTCCNGPGFDPSIRRHSGIWGAADEAVLNIVRTKKKKSPKKYLRRAYEEWISAHAQPAVKCEHFYMYNPCWAYAEQILSHTEHTGN